jgi:hypothetical protein
LGCYGSHDKHHGCGRKDGLRLPDLHECIHQVLVAGNYGNHLPDELRCSHCVAILHCVGIAFYGEGAIRAFGDEPMRHQAPILAEDVGHDIAYAV